MIRLDRIYTGGGDQGMTSTGDGHRVSKLHPRIVAGGAVDELNCALGCAAATLPAASVDADLKRLQQFLFDLGADLCTPFHPDVTPSQPSTRISDSHVLRLEQMIDAYNSRLQPLTSFVLPGGTPLSASLHLARGICRRAEVEVLKLSEAEPVNPQLLICLNRLSDLLFVMARDANAQGTSDVLWQPGNSILAPEQDG